MIRLTDTERESAIHDGDVGNWQPVNNTGQNFLYVGLPDEYSEYIKMILRGINNNGGDLDVVDADLGKTTYYNDWVEANLPENDSSNITFISTSLQEYLDTNGKYFESITLDSIFNRWRYEKETQYEFLFKIIEICYSKTNHLTVYLDANKYDESYNMIYVFTVLTSTYDDLIIFKSKDRYDLHFSKK